MMCLTQRGPAKWRVTVYDVIFGKLRFLDSNQQQLTICKLYRKPNLWELSVNGKLAVILCVQNLVYFTCLTET